QRRETMLKLIRVLEGEGELDFRWGDATPANYSIGVWRGPDGMVFGRGYISGDVAAICAAAASQGPIPVRLCQGGQVEIVVTGRGAGKPWAEVYVSKPPPEPPGVQHRAAWPD